MLHMVSSSVYCKFQSLRRSNCLSVSVCVGVTLHLRSTLLSLPEASLLIRSFFHALILFLSLSLSLSVEAAPERKFGQTFYVCTNYESSVSFVMTNYSRIIWRIWAENALHGTFEI